MERDGRASWEVQCGTTGLAVMFFFFREFRRDTGKNRKVSEWVKEVNSKTECEAN